MQVPSELVSQSPVQGLCSLQVNPIEKAAAKSSVVGIMLEASVGLTLQEDPSHWQFPEQAVEEEMNEHSA